ncbi:MAG: enoyl-CoA hydratase/isomerase family protein [Acetobacteraceae bacterium]|nr:enoyl-CoA hydratase/isomerase family protein [Acetobacteraceae bacterium]
MNNATMLTETREGPVLVLTMNYPERRNALAMPMREAMIAALERAEADRDVRALVLTGAGGIFSSGGDISAMGARDIAAGRERFRITHRFVRLMIESSRPIIAAVEGWAAGAGMSVALCCDTIIAAEDARFVASFGRVGLMGDLGLLHTLPARVGQGRARQILLYGEPVDAPRAEQMGLIDQVVPNGRALEAALQRAQMFAAAAPLPVALTKRWLAQGLAEALERERDLQTMLFLSADHAEGVEAFMQKRKPFFKGG